MSDKKRILFVDDDQLILDGLRRSLRANAAQWDMTFVTSGEKAMEAIRAQEFEVLVSDMRMPGMSGDELLDRVARQHPSIARIILSGHAARDATSRAVALAHRYLAKPIETEALRHAIDECLLLQDIIASSMVRDLVGGTSALPAMPDIYIRVKDAIDKDDASATEISGIIARDAGMCAKLLHVVNSSYYGLSKPVSGIDRAIDMIGRRRLKSLVLSTALFEVLEPESIIDGFDLRDLQSVSLLAANIAYSVLIDDRPDREAAEQAYIGALLHQIGRMIIAVRRPDLLRELIHGYLEGDRSPAEVELEVLGANQGRIGAYLLGLWTLPAAIVEAVGQHQAPTSELGQKFSVSSAVHVGTAFAAAIRANRFHQAESNYLNMEYLTELGVDGRIREWIEIISKQYVQNQSEAA